VGQAADCGPIAADWRCALSDLLVDDHAAPVPVAEK